MKYVYCIILTLFFITSANLSKAQGNCLDRFKDVGLPKAWGITDTQTIICRKGYALSYNPRTKNPDWVIEKLTADRFIGEATREKSNFKEDKSLPPNTTATLKDYKGSGYDRGHQAPAADMKWHQDAMDESFYLSNMAPQVGVGFNRGVWRYLEAEIREWAKTHHVLFVITGPVYFDYAPTIGEGEVVIPDSFYKIVFNPKINDTIAFLLPNMKLENKNYPSFIVSIREIEQKTGLNFLGALPFRLQNQIEMAPVKMWTKESLQSSR